MQLVDYATALNYYYYYMIYIAPISRIESEALKLKLKACTYIYTE